MKNLELRPYRAGDDESFLALHNQCFVSKWSRAMWDWRYKSIPRGEGLLLGAYAAGDRLVGMYGGVRLGLHIQGAAGWALSQGDVAVDADFRHGKGEANTAVMLGRTFLGEHGGGSTKLTYGFPVPPLRRMATRYLGGEVLTDVIFVVHELQDLPPEREGVEVRRVARFDEQADSLWETVRGEFGAALVRDAIYLNWRYADHPLDYTLIEARQRGSGSLRGLCVLREGGWAPNVASLVEWLVPSQDDEAEGALLRRSIQFARERGKSPLVAWFSSAGPHFRRFQNRYGFFAHATPYQEEITSWQPGADREWLLENWYQTMGDIDFF